MFDLLVKMLYILVLCRVLLIAGVQTLTIDSQLGTSIEDCFERIAIGEHLPADAIYRNVSELTNRECEQICKQDKQCQAYDYGVGAKGNATCNLSILDEKTIKEQSPLKRHPDYDLYIRRFQCEQSPPTPIQPLSDEPGPGPQHRPVFRPEIDERPSAEDYLISADLGYGKPPENYRPDDASNNKPDFDIGPGYGDHKPQDIPFKPDRPNDSYRPERPNDPLRPNKPNVPNRPERPPYGSERPQDAPYGFNRPNDAPYGYDRPHDLPYGINKPNDLPYGPSRPNDVYKPSQRPETNDVLQFQGVNKPKPLADEYIRPDLHKPDNPESFYYIVRPNRKPRPQNDYPNDLYGHPSGPIGPPNRPYRPTNAYDKPTYTYHSQYASNYGQNTQNDNTIYVEINDPPKPYIPIKDRPNQQYNGQGYLGYGTYSSQNSYSQSQNDQYSSFITEIGGYGQRPYDQKPGYKPHDERPHRPGSSSSHRPNDYERPYGSQDGYGSNQSGHGSNQDSYSSTQSGYGSNQGNYGNYQASYNTNKGSYNKGEYSNQYGGNRPINDHSNYGETGYGSQAQRPNNRPNDQGPYGGQNSYKGSYSSSYNEQNSHQASYNSHASYETHRPSYEHGYNKPEKPQKPFDKPNDNQDSYGSNHGGYGSNQDVYGSNQASYGSNQGSHSSQSYGSSGYGSNQGNYGSSYGNNQGSDSFGQSGNRPGLGGDGGYGSTQGYGSNQGGYSSNQGNYGSNQGGYDSNQGGYGATQGGYGFSSTSSYGSAQSHGETQFADHSIYGGYGNRPNQNSGYGNNRPDYSNRPDYDYERPGYGHRPSYGQKPSQDQAGYGQKPNYDSQTTGYGQAPSYNDPKPGYNDPRPGYNDPKPGYNDPKPGYNDPKPGYNDPKPGYNDPKPGYNDPKPGYNDPKPGYNDPKPGYNDPKPDNDKPDPPYDVKPVYEHDLDRPNNVPAYIAKPGGEVVTSRPVVIGDYGERPVYKEPGVPRKDVFYKACFRRVLAGQRALRSFVRRVAPCETLEDCRRECAEERRFHCESFNYRMDPSFRGKGLCELMTKPIEAFDLRRDFVQDKDYDFYEIDRNSLEPNCPETLRGPGLLHSGFLSSKDRDDRNRPNRLDPNDRNRPSLDGWRDRDDWVGGRGDGYTHKGGNRRYEDRFVPYQIGTRRPENNQQNWGQYGGLYGGTQYYKNRNEYTKSISHWGLTSERPTYGVRPYTTTHDYRNGHDHGNDRNDFDYYSLGKNLRKYFESHPKDDDFDTYNHGHKDHNRFDYHGDDRTSIEHGFVLHGGDHFDRPLGREDGKDSSEEDFYGVGKSLHRYGYGAWKKGRWNVSGVTNGIDEDSSKTYYEAADRNDEIGAKDCFSRRRPGMSLGTGAIRRSLITRNVVACEAACFGEKQFKCVSYSYRYSNSRGADNCFLSERPFHGLDLSADSGSDVYAMPQDQGCSTLTHTPWIESECFYHVRSDGVVSGPAAQSSLTVAGLGACEAECIRAQGFFCRGFSFRFDAPTIGEELHNCILTASPTPSLSGDAIRRAGGHELYARGNYGRGCEPHANDVKDNGECYLQYDKAAKLTPSATRGHARVKDEQSCSNACTEAPFKCLSFSYNNNAPPDSDNCLLSEIRLFDLQKDVDYVHSGDDWLFAFDLFNSKCWRRVHSEDPTSSEIPHPIHTSSSEEDLPSGPTGTGYLPDTSGPPSGPDTSYRPGSGPSYHPHPEPEYKPHYPPSSAEKTYPSDPSYKPSYSGFKPGYPDSPQPGYGPPEYPTYKPEEPYKPGFRPEPFRPGSRPDEPYRPGSRPDEPYRPGSRPDEPYRPGSRPDESYRPGLRPDGPYRPGSRPDEPYRPGSRPDEPYRPGSRPDESYGPGFRPEEPNRPGYRPAPPLRPPESDGYKPFRPDLRPDLPGPYKPGFRPGDDGLKPGYGGKPGYLPDKRPERPDYQGDREGGPLEVPWRHYTVSGFPCRSGTTCAQNVIVGHWACEPEGGEIGSWDYCCAPSHRCGYSEGFHKPWCYVGPKEDQWRPCSEKYYPYHQHNVPHPSSQGHRDERPSNRPWRDTPHSPPREYTPHWDQPPGPYLSPADKQYWDDLYRDGPRAYYDKYGNPLPGYSRVPTEDRPRIRNRYNPPQPGSGTWVPVSHEDPTGVPGSLGAPRYWPVAYLHKDPPPNTTYFRYNETRPTTTTEKSKNERTTLPPLPPLSRELPSQPRDEKPDDLDAKSTRDDKKINISKTDEEFNSNVDNNTVKTTTEVILEKELNISEVESMKTENYKDIDRIDGIDDKLDDFSKSIEVLDIEDAQDDKSSDLKMLEDEERQIEAIGRLLAARRGTKLVLEKRSQKDLETKNIAIDKDLVDFNFGNRFPTSDRSGRRSERRGVIKRISKDEIERDRNADKSLEVSETTFVRPPRVLSTTENIRKAIVNGKVFYDATIREQRDITNATQKPLKLEETTHFVTNNNFREQRDIYLNSTRKPKHLKRANETKTSINVTNLNNTRRSKNLRLLEDPTLSNIQNLREERDTRQNVTRKLKRRQDDSTITAVGSSVRDLYLNSSRKAKSLRRLEESSTPSVIANSSFGKRKVLVPRNTNPVRRVRRVYRKRYNPEEVRKRLLERDRNRNSTEFVKKV